MTSAIPACHHHVQVWPGTPELPQWWAALRRRARERGASLSQTVIDALASALGAAEAGGEPDPVAPPPADGDVPHGLERDALDEGLWL